MTNSVKSCPECAGALGKGILFEPLNLKICQDCFDNIGLCTVCEDTIRLEDAIAFDDHFYCETCFTENYFHCESCGNADHNDELYSSENGECYCQGCYYEFFLCCPRCDCETSRDYTLYVEDSDEDVCRDCYESVEDVSLESYNSCYVEPPVEGDTLSTNRFERAVGVEIETIGYNAEEISNDNNFSAFNITSDGSISSDSEEDGIEFVSKPMRGDHLFHEIDKICSFLFENDFRVNRSCGLHVHIDARDLFYKDLKGISMVMNSFERVVFSMMPKSRYSSNWCKRMAMNKNMIREINSNKDFIHSWYNSCDESPSMGKYNEARYHGLNLHARVYLGTIEFRYHSGTNNPTKIKNWITICQSIVEKGIALGKVMDEVPEDWDSKTHKFMTEGDLGLADFIDMLELDGISQYIIGRVRKFDNYTSEIDRQYVVNNFTSV
jgi:hypothetical protein